jgi:predicted amino acid dehydrogenase
VSKVAILLRKMSLRRTSEHGAQIVGLGGFRSV